MNWILPHGKIISDEKMTEIRLNYVKMYTRELKLSTPIRRNRKLAEKIRNMSNMEFNLTYGIAVLQK